MRAVEIYRDGLLAGTMTEESRGRYLFTYNEVYYDDATCPAVSLTLPKTQKEYRSEYLFPVFFNMLSEGVNRKLQSTQLHIDEQDHFGLLMATAQYDTIGALTVKPVV